MTIPELRQKHPEETKLWQDEQCQGYCKSLETLSNLFIDYVDKQLKNTPHKDKVDTYAN